MTTYWDRTQWPLQGLYFLLPLLVVYEIGTLLYVPADSASLPKIRAWSLLEHFFELFGITGVYLPGLIVVVVLLCWHVVRRDPWRPESKLYIVMWLESLGYALPLLMFSAVLFREPVAGWTLAAPSGPLAQIPNWQSGVLLSIGAGIYEELLFRLIAIALLHTILVDLLALPERWGAALAVIGSAIAFALYHFPSPGAVQLGRFAFYTAAGIYFAVIYVVRGFGIVVGTHALYDVLVVTLLFAQQEA